MHTPAMIIATSHINDLLAESAANRLAKQATTSKERQSPLAAALNGLRSILAEPVEKPVLPELKAYPYRS